MPKGVRMQVKRRQIPSFVILPGRKIVDFSVITEPKLEIAGKIMEILSSFGSSVITGTIDLAKDGMLIEGFLDITGMKVPLEELFDVLRTEEGVREAYHGMICENFKVFSAPSVPFAGSHRLVIFRLEHIAGFMNMLKKRWGSAGASVLYALGHNAGIDSIRQFRRIIRAPNRELIEFLLMLGRSFGWYTDYELVKLGEKGGIGRFYDLFECKIVEGKLNKPNSQWMRGFFVGIFDELYRVRVSVEETRCIAKGDPYCEFVAER
ncbi:hypothetical protein DRN86_00220 [Candidatus Geothermarchaeota archaeon]|nr:MAG: hypothetical protein DRN86_00220 [Candidatus Geothermarchaeota archaeon]